MNVWVVVIIATAIWGLVTIISKIVDGVVSTKNARLEFEKEYLTQMISDLEEIKARLDAHGINREPGA